MRLKKKESHNNDLIPTYETNKKQTDQTRQNKTERKKQKSKPMQPLSSAADMKVL